MKVQHLTDSQIEVKKANAKVKRLTKKQLAAQAQLDSLNATTAAAIAPLEAELDESKAKLAAIIAQQEAFEAKCAARKAARMAASA